MPCGQFGNPTMLSVNAAIASKFQTTNNQTFCKKNQYNTVQL